MIRATDSCTVVLLDKHPLWLDTLAQVLSEGEIDVVAKAISVEGALSAIAETQPDVFVSEFEAHSLDPHMEALRSAKTLHPDIHIVALGPTDDWTLIASAFDAGADVYCVKTAEGEDLLTAIHQALRQSIYVARPREPVTQALPCEDSAVEALDTLTKRELEILRLVAEGHSNLQLARMLWVTEQTVKFHLSNIYRKLKVSNRTEASRWAQVHGLLPAATAPEPATVG